VTPAVRFFLIWLAVLAAVDLAFWLGQLPGGTISVSVRRLGVLHPWLPWAYLALCAIGHQHFFGAPRV
jgi:hypothetical protein